MKKIATTLSILAVALTLSSVSYAGGDVSPGKKATTIESIALPSYSFEAINLAPVMVASFAIEQVKPTENIMIVKRCEALPVTGVKPTAVKMRWRTGKSYCNYNNDVTRSPQKHDSTKFSDRHRRLCNVG